jgi:hypothetical protein
MMLTVVQGLSVSRRCERASESSEAENERDFFCVRGTTEGSRRTHRLPIRILIPDASSLDKEDGWEFAYLLLHVTCAH